jgi:ADP-ribose pyrophosphatase YjhB (NUDIX family)
MRQKYIVYRNKHALYLNNCHAENHYHKIDLKEGNAAEKIKMSMELLKNENNVCIPDCDAEFVVDQLKKIFILIDAAGGIVESPDGKILMIYRLNHWDLPKGKVEPHESNESGALREIMEETGVSGLKLISFICKTWHIYQHKEKDILKETSWFHVKASKETPLIPQLEEQIQLAEWVLPEEIPNLTSVMYPSVRDVILSFMENSKPCPPLTGQT